MPARFSTLRVTFSGPVSMIDGSEPIDVKARMRARGLRPGLLARLLAADQDGGGAVDDARRVAGVMHVLDALDLRVALVHHRIEPEVLAQLARTPA